MERPNVEENRARATAPSNGERTRLRALRFIRLFGRRVRLQLIDEAIIVRMRADPEPDDLVPIANAQRAIPFPDPCGIDVLRSLYGSEAETWMIRVLFEDSVGFAGLRLNRRGQACEGVAKPLRGS